MSLWDKYKILATSNIEIFRSIDSTVRSMLYYDSTMLSGEYPRWVWGCFALSLLSSTNEYLLLRRLQKANPTGSVPNGPDLPPVAETKYVWLLDMLSRSEIYLEIGVHQTLGNRARWLFVAAVEFAKAFLKCALLVQQRSSGALLLHRTELPNGLSSDNLPPTVSAPRQSSLYASDALEMFRDMAANPEQFSKPAPALVDMFDGVFFVEIVRIFQRLVYLFAMLVFGRKSWKALLLSFGIEYWTLQSAESLSRQKELLSKIELDEASNRKMLLWWYLVRSPVFELLVRKRPQFFIDFVARLEKLPLVGAIFGMFPYFVQFREYFSAINH